MIRAVIEDGMVEETNMTEQTGRMDDAVRTLIEMVIGILFFGLVCELVGILIVEDKLYYSIGLWYGCALAGVMAWHMWRSIGRGLLMGESGAPKYLASANVIRYVIVAVLYIALCAWDFGSPIAAFIGIMSLKVTAYLQPITHKCFKKFYKM